MAKKDKQQKNINAEPVTDIKAPKVNKVKKGGKAGLVLFLVFFVIVGALVAGVYFDLFGLKGIARDALDMNPTPEDELVRIAALDAREKDIEDKDAALADKIAALNKRESAVKQREDQLAEQEAKAIEEKQSTAGSDATIQATVTMVEKMDAAKAAKIIGGLTNAHEMASILSLLKSDKAAAILDNMEATLASQVLAEMMGT